MNQPLLPNIWGRGVLFSYSGLLGECHYESLCGQLLQDHLGMRLGRDYAMLYLDAVGRRRDDTVASDLIEGGLGDRDAAGNRIFKPYAFLALDKDTFVGYSPAKAKPCFRADLAKEQKENLYIFEKYTYAFLTELRGEEYVFALCKKPTAEEALVGAQAGLNAEIRTIADQRRAFFEAVPKLPWLNELQQRTLAKAFSIMKGQVNTPEGIFKQLWTTPERFPHQRLYLWDSVYHSFGNIHLNPQLAFDTIRSVLDSRYEDGEIPCSASPAGPATPESQPPLLAWAVYRLFKATGRIDWVEACWQDLVDYLDWNFKNRDSNHNLLFEWDVNEEVPDCRCGESGMDNTPRFDGVTPMDCVDFSSFMANEMRYMSAMAKALGKQEQAIEYARLYQKIGDQINKYLYCEQDGRYYDRFLNNGEFNRCPTTACFTPLLAGICPPDRAKKMAEDLLNPETFGLPHMVPTVAANHKDFSIDYWRGTTWISYNYLIEQGMREAGFTAAADRIVDATIDMISYWYGRTGSIYEVYDPKGVLAPFELHRKGPPVNPYYACARLQIVADFGWSASLYAAMIMERDARMKGAQK